MGCAAHPYKPHINKAARTLMEITDSRFAGPSKTTHLMQRDLLVLSRGITGESIVTSTYRGVRPAAQLKRRCNDTSSRCVVRRVGPDLRTGAPRAGRARGGVRSSAWNEAWLALEHALLQHEPVDFDAAEPHLVREDFLSQEVMAQVLYALLLQSGRTSAEAIAQTKNAIHRARSKADRRIGALL